MATTAANHNIQYISSNSTFSCNVISLLLGSTSSITSGISYGSHGVIRGLQYCTKNNEKYTRILRSLFTAICNLLDREIAHTEMISITWRFKWILATLEFTEIAMSWLRNFTVVQYLL